MAVVRKRPRRNPNAKAKPIIRKQNTVKVQELKENQDENITLESKENIEQVETVKDIRPNEVGESNKKLQSKPKAVKKNQEEKNTPVKKNDNFFAKMKGLIWF